MIARCYCATHPSFERYGARGVTVCDRWRGYPEGFLHFVADMGEPPSADMAVERIGSDGLYDIPYGPDNCIWANRLACADCSVCTVRLNEYYMVHDDVWEQAWAGRRESWQLLQAASRLSVWEILCIGCLEQRIGRTLMASDFIDAPVNDPNHPQHGRMSERMRHRLSAVASTPLGTTKAEAPR